MDEVLKAQLKEAGLFPIELDSEAQRRFREQGIDPTTLETHLSPGTQTNREELYQRITDNVLRLNYMESEGCRDHNFYEIIEAVVRRDLHTLTFHCNTPTPPSTGTVGFSRDV